MAAHSRYSPSQSHRWLNCPGSLSLIDSLIPQDASESPDAPSKAAEEGTRAHAVLAANLELFYSGKDPNLMGDSDEMTQGVGVALRYIIGLELDQVFIENTVQLRNSPVFGTPDFVGFEADAKILHIIDFKFGRHPVPITTPQLLIYALGAIDTYKLAPEQIVLTLIQPRAYGVYEGQEGSSRVVSAGELTQFRKLVDHAVRESEMPVPTLSAGEHCRWCPAAAVCPALRSTALTIAQQEFHAEPVITAKPPAPETLPNPIVADLLSKVPILEAWVEALREHAMKELAAGNEIPGFKLAPKNTHRKWTSEKDARDWLLMTAGFEEKDILDQSLLSPAQIEKKIERSKIPAELVAKEIAYRIVKDAQTASAKSPKRLTKGASS